MRDQNLGSRALGLLLAAALAAGCGGGGSSPPSGNTPPPAGGIDRGGISFGAITGFGSIIVNGVRFDTSGARFIVNGTVGSQDDLRVGQVVLVSGSVSDDEVSGEAETVEYDDEVKGPVESLDAAAGTFRVLGLLVRTGAQTLYGGFADFDDLAAATSQGAVVVEVSGFRDASGAILATRIDRESEGIEFELKGVVSALDAGAMTFSLGTLTVDYGSAFLPDGPPANGDFVEARGDLSGDTLTASSVELEDGIDDGIDDGARVEVEGLVTRVVSASRFEVGGVAVETGPATVYERGTAADIRVDVRLEAEGSFDASTGVLRAVKVEFGGEGDFELEGVVQSVGSSGFRAVGVDVTADIGTAYEDDRDDDQFFGLSRLAVGDFVEVRGTAGSGGEFVAQLVERDEEDPDSLLQGLAANVDSNAGSFTIFGVTIDTSGVDAEDFLNAAEQPIGRAAFFAALDDGVLVKAKGQFDGAATIAAREVQLED
jgi:hypothetical protein